MKIFIFVLLATTLLAPVAAATCSVPQPGCRSCSSGDPTSCNQCDAGYKFTLINSVGSCSMCPMGTGRDADLFPRREPSFCDISCPAGCLFCGATPENCFGCIAGYKYELATKFCIACFADTGRAINTLPQTTDTTCDVTCSGDCKFCAGSPTECVGCFEGYQLNFATKTCTYCPVGMWKAADETARFNDGVCSSYCATGGLFCGTNQYWAFSCQAGYSYNHFARRCTACPSGYTKLADTGVLNTDTTCDIKCDTGCSLCGLTGSDCLGCMAGYFYDVTAKKCSLCSPGEGSSTDFYIRSSSSTCGITCAFEGCYSCNAGTCLACRAGFKWAPQKNCASCEPGTGRAADTLVFPVAATTCDVVCDPSCKFCGATATECTGCYAGFRYDSENKACVACPSGYVGAEHLKSQVVSTRCVSKCAPACGSCDPSSPDICLSCAEGYQSVFTAGQRMCVACSGGQGRGPDEPTNTINTVCHVECVLGCETCSENRHTCIACSAGYYMSQLGVCTLCRFGWGKPYDVYPAVVTTTDGVAECSVACQTGCNSCFASGPNGCLNCDYHYWFDGVSVCTRCNNDIQTKYRDSDILKKVGSQSDCWRTCWSYCSTCNGPNDNQCLRCKEGYYNIGDGFCSECPYGRGKLADTSDKTSPDKTVISTAVIQCSIVCYPGCKHCTGTASNECTSCQGGFRKTSTNECIICDDGKGNRLQSGITGPTVASCTDICDRACRICDNDSWNNAPSPYFCVMCAAGHYMSSNSYCQLCPDGTGKAKDTIITRYNPVASSAACFACDPACRICSGAGSSACISCNPGYWWSAAGVCTACAPYYGTLKMTDLNPTVLQTAGVCFQCATTGNCQSCFGTSANQCSRCVDGYYMSSEGTCSLCPAGKGKTFDTLTFRVSTTGGVTECSVTCDKSCSNCSSSGAGQCLLCAAGYYFTGPGTCTPCDAGFGKPADTLKYIAPTTSAIACTVTCHEACATCSGYGSNNCITCNQGYFYSAAKTCTLCPTGTGKGADSAIVTANSDGSTFCQVPCPNSPICLTCGQTGTCLMCDRGYYKPVAGGCLPCDAGFGKPADTSTLTVGKAQNVACYVTCPDACISCFGTGSDQCLKCNTGYYKSGPTTCTMCSKGKGKDVDATVIVPVGMVDPNIACDVTCNPASNCLTCKDTAANGCLNCPSSNYLDGSAGDCKLCRNGNFKYADSKIMTPLPVNSICTIPCDPSCQACQEDATACFLCAPGYYWTAEGQCTVCNNQRGSDPSVFYLAPQLEADACYYCDSTCLGCSGRTQNDCIRCRGGEYLTNANACVLCTSGKGKLPDAGAVKPSFTSGFAECILTCHANCRNCYGVGANECTSCKPGYYFSGAGTCAQCPPYTGKYEDTVIQLTAADPQTVCSTCHSSCYSCGGPNANHCIQCAAGHFYAGSGICTKCNVGTGKDLDSGIPSVIGPNACTAACDPKCGICKGTAPLDCLNCAAGFWWAGSGVCTQCDDSFGKVVDSEVLTGALTKNVCNANCDESCLTCSQTSVGTCVKCSAGFFRSASLTCTICPVGTGKSKDQSFTSVSGSAGVAECDIACHPSCRTCRDATAQSCLDCNEGYFMPQLGTCQLCAAGTGKPYDTVMVKAAQPPATCITCDTSCVHCSGTGPSKCLNCNAGMYLNNIGTCARCPDGRGKPADTVFAVLRAPNSDGTQECTVRCHASCNVCKGPTENDCLNCNAGYYFGGNGRCLQCELGTGKLADVPFIPAAQQPSVCTIPCDETCKNCIGELATDCLSCAASFYKQSAGTCTRCPAKKGKRADPFPYSEPTTADLGCDITCAYPCSICSGPSAEHCISCTAGYYLQSLGKCSKCAFSKGKILDQKVPELSTTSGAAECTIDCHPTCSSCGDTTAIGCIGCSQGFFWDNGICKNCPMSTSLPQNDLTGYVVAQTGSICTLKCHKSCQMCSGPGELECLSCSPGYWLASEGKCQSCPSGRGKPADQDLFPTVPATEEACNIFCDICSSGCQTCSGDPYVCASCVSGRYLTSEGTCTFCPDNCISCTEANKCDMCSKNYKITADGKGCIGDCKIENCIECAEDPSKCTKCNDEYVLKSETECIVDRGTVVVDELRAVSVLTSPQLSMDILSNKVELAFSARESRNFTSLTVQDKLTGIVYSCQQVSCAYAIKNDKLSLSFGPSFSIVQGKLTIERGGSIAGTPSAIKTNFHNRRRVLENQANYPIVVDNIALMQQSYLNTMSFALRVTVGILRLPLSLAVFWKYPHLAMLMDQMVTHLKIYSLLGQPYMAYVEVVYQSVSESKVLPFNFANPFEKWNPDTLNCEGYPGIRCKNLHCSWLDNYGANFIGLLAVGLLIIILSEVSRRLAPAEINSKSSFGQRLLSCISADYGLHYIVAKFDGNHVEIVLMTVIAYCTAEGSSKSVVGLIIGTLALGVYGAMTLRVTLESQTLYSTKPTTAIQGQARHSTSHAAYLEASKANNSPDNPTSQQSDGKPKESILTEYRIPRNLEFTLNASSKPNNKWSVYFFAVRYVRALLLAIFVTTVRDPVEQVVLVVVLESVYLVALILLDFRGSRAERIFYTAMHALMLLHLILRAVATSKSLSDRDVQSSLAAAIVVILMVYIFSHVIAALLVLAGIFKTAEQPVVSPAANKITFKLELADGDEIPPEAIQGKVVNEQAEALSLPFAMPNSFQDLDIPEEFSPQTHSQQDSSPIEMIVKVDLKKLPVE